MSTDIPFLDLHSSYLELKAEIDAAVARVLDSGQYILGPEVEAFEAEFAEYCEAKYAVAVANGLDALHLSLLALDVGPGDEVIVPSNTYIATWLAVSQCGARPVPVEPDEHTYNIDPELIEAAITPRTKVILPVHLYGQPADLGPILEVAHRHGVRVLEDAAQAHGARYKDRFIGGHGDAVCWSFYPAKNLGAVGDGGAVTTNDPEIVDRIRLLRNYGSRVKYVNEIKGFNSRLDPVQAAVLRVKLKRLNTWNQHRKEIAKLYRNGLAASRVILPHTPEWTDPVWHLFVLRTDQRDRLASRLNDAGISTLIHYPIPPHQQPAYSDSGYGANEFPLATRISKEIISLPIGPHLKKADSEIIIEIITNLIQ